MADEGREVFMLEDGVALSRSESVAPGDESIIHTERKSRGESGGLTEGDDTVLVRNDLSHASGGTGLLIYVQGPGDSYTNFASDAADELGVDFIFRDSDDQLLDEAILVHNPMYLIIICNPDDTDDLPTESEQNAFANFWEDVGQASIYTEDSPPPSSRGPRVEAANAYIEAALDVVGFNDSEESERDYACYSGDIIPTGEHPVFEGIETLHRAPDEALITENNPPVYGVRPSHPENIWGYADTEEGRMWLDGGWVGIRNDWYGDCEDEEEYLRRSLRWVTGEL